MTALLEAHGLEKRYRGQVALDSLSFEVGGRVVALLGPNGAGKSTLIKLMLGLALPSSGRLQVMGLDSVTDSLAIRKRAGVLHENPRFPGQRTGRAYLDFAAAIADRSGADVAELAREFGLERDLDRPVRGYSAGMTQRLGLIGAFLGAPDLVILDEPTSNLDPAARADFLSFIARRVATSDVRIIICTHQLTEVEQVCDAAIVLDGGRLVAHGPLDALIADGPSEWRIRVDDPSRFSRDLAASIPALAARVEGDVVIAEGARSGEDDLILAVNELVRGRRHTVKSFYPQRRSLLDLYRSQVGKVGPWK